MSYEVEVKALLGKEEAARALRRNLEKLDKACRRPISKNTQLNHYFERGDLQKLSKALTPLLPKEAAARLEKMTGAVSDYSVRTRDKDGQVFIVIKASVDDTSSSNGISRMEFEERIPLTLKALDKLVLKGGFSYQAKWSRQREEYTCKGVNVTLDRNAGYGWVSEFERVVRTKSQVKRAEKEVRNLMAHLHVAELPQERLARMFKYYNKHWRKYYGTQKVFTVK